MAKKNTSNTSKRGRMILPQSAPKASLTLSAKSTPPVVYHKDGVVWAQVRPGIYHGTPLSAIADYYKA